MFMRDNNEGRGGFLRVIEIISLIALLAFLAWKFGPALIQKFRGESSVSSDAGPEANSITGGDIILSEEELLNKFVTTLSAGKTSVNVGMAPQSEIDSVIYKVYDAPEFFWLDNSYTISTIGGYSIVNFKKIYEDVDAKNAQIEKACDDFFAAFPDDGDDFTKVRYIHDTLCDRIVYKDTGSLDDHNIYGALVKGECVCEGYTKAFSYLLGKKGIRNITFSGTANNGDISENHSWNGVYMDGDLYYFDVTWDDQEEYGTMYTYFGMTSAEISMNHFFDEYHQAVPADATADNYFVYNGYVIDSYSEEALAEIIAEQGNVIDVKCTGIVPYQDMTVAIENPMKFAQVLSLAGPEFGLKEGYKYLNDDNTKSVRIFLE